jgi:hypothetical protein
LRYSSPQADDDAASKEKLAMEWMKHMKGEWEVKVQKWGNSSGHGGTLQTFHASAKLINRLLVAEFAPPLPKALDDKMMSLAPPPMESCSLMIVYWNGAYSELRRYYLSGKIADQVLRDVRAEPDYSRDPWKFDRLRLLQFYHGRQTAFREISIEHISSRNRRTSSSSIRKTDTGFVFSDRIIVPMIGGFNYELVFTRIKKASEHKPPQTAPSSAHEPEGIE